MGEVVGIFYLFFFIIWLFAMLVSIAVSVLSYVLTGMGVSRMAKALGVANPNGAFVPFYRMKILGDVAEESAVRNRSKRRSYGKILLGLYIGNYAVMFLFFIAIFASSIILSILKLELSMPFVLITLLCYAVIFPLAIVWTVFYYMAIYQIYKCFSPDLAVVWLLLSIFVQPAQIILPLILSKNTPAPYPSYDQGQI